MSQILPTYKQIAAIVPQYTPAGDSTRLITVTGAEYSLGVRVKTVLKQLARQHAVDLAVLRANTACTTRRQLLQPLSIAPGLLLCPVKVRKPEIAGDTCTGYINIYAVSEVRSTGTATAAVRIHSGAEINVLWSQKTVEKYLRDARLAKSQSAYSARYPENDCAEIALIATKLVEVIYDILTLKQKQG